MKSSIHLFFLAVFSLALGACNSPRSASVTSASRQAAPSIDPNAPVSVDQLDEKEYTPNLSLVDILRRQPGVRVQGSGDNARVSIRNGGMSFSGNTEPLFVLDGSILGVGYRSASGVEVNDIDSIQVLRDASSTGRYGMNGANGVILINTKREN